MNTDIRKLRVKRSLGLRCGALGTVLVAGGLLIAGCGSNGSASSGDAVARVGDAVIDRNQLYSALEANMGEQALVELIVHQGRVVHMSDIDKAVCEVFGLEPESLQSNRKGKAVSRPRALAMYLARKLTRAPLSEIGAYFGRKSHSTVISASKKIEGWMAKQAPLQVANAAVSLEETIRRVEERLRAG